MYSNILMSGLFPTKGFPTQVYSLWLYIGLILIFYFEVKFCDHAKFYFYLPLIFLIKIKLNEDCNE